MKDLFKLNKPFFEKDGAPGGAPAEPKKETDDSAGGKDAKKAGDASGETKPEKMFSQAELEQIIKDRLEREHKKQEEAALKLKEEAEKKALEEQGKHKELAEKASKEAEQAKAAQEAALSALKTERVRFTVLTKAMQMSFAEPEDAMKLLDFSDLTFGDDGSPNADSINKKLEELVKAKPYLVKAVDEQKSFGTPKKKTSIPTKDDVKPNFPVPKF